MTTSEAPLPCPPCPQQSAREHPRESAPKESTAASFALLERLRPPDPKDGGDDDEALEAPPSSRPPPHPSDRRVGVGVPDAPQALLEEVLSWRRTAAGARISDDTDQKCPSLPFYPPRNRPRKVSPHRDANNKDTSSTLQLLGLVKVLVTFLIIRPVSASEFPDRECCDNPLYKFDPPGSVDRGPVTFTPPRMTYSPPEVPDFPEFAPPEVPPIGFPGSGSGVLTSTPAAGSLGCLLARTLCSEDSACSQILQVIPRVCGLELVTCSTPTVTKCQAALRTLQSFPFFNPTCLCKEPRLDPDCNQFKDFLVDHPCLNAKLKDPDPYPVDALPTCHHAEDVCNNDPTCRNKVQTFTNSCPVRRGQCVMKDVQKCHKSWQHLRQSPIFGCFCPSNLAQKARCDEVFERVNSNDCIDAQLPDTLRVVYTNLARASQFWTFWYRILDGPSGGRDISGGQTPERPTRQTASVDERTTPYNLPTTVDRNRVGGTSQSDEEVLNLRSTCHTALDACERDSSCRVYLETLKSRCVESCSKERCMAAVKQFYRSVPKKHSLDVAFCLCKKNGNDEQCFRAQNILHPPCAQTPVGWNGEEADLPSCHTLARDCRNSKSCQLSLERYEQACSVDSDTKTCAGSYHWSGMSR